jgi:glycosyltransferase involved in cell wall biosynthesis
MPVVSVIIPNYNHAPYLRQRIDTVLGQTYQDFEVILMDDCSTDESRAIISEYAGDPRVRIEFNEKNSGSPFKQWKKGIALARGRYIWIAESDDYADETLLETLVSRLDADSNITLCNCRSWRVTEDAKIIGYLIPASPPFDITRWEEDFCADGREECKQYLVYCCTVLNASSVLFRKEIYDRVAGVDETMCMCGDWKLWAAMALKGKIAHVGGKPLNYYREHDTSATNRSLRSGIYVAEYLQVVRWILQKLALEEATPKWICEGLFDLWYPDVLTSRVPPGKRWEIVTNAMAIDPHAVRRLIRPGLVALRMTVGRRWRSLRGNLSTPSKSG